MSNESTSLTDLFFDREWDLVRDEGFLLEYAVESGDHAHREYNDGLSEFEGEDGTTLLHVMCRFQPPLDLVELVADELPWMIDAKEPLTGQHPVHVACLYGSRSDVVKFLLSKNAEAAMTSDKEGRMPIHLACRPIRWLPDDMREEGHANEPVYIQAGSAVIQALCAQAPRATNVDDRDGCNPLEIALDHGLSNKVCQILLDASDIGWKERKAEEEEKDGYCYGDSSVHTEEFSLPGYTPSAAKEHLKRIRSNQDFGDQKSSALNASDATLSLRNIGYNDADDTSITTAGSMAELSSSLPPYEEMLQRYQEMNSSLRSTVGRSDGELQEREDKSLDNIRDSASVPKNFHETAATGRRQSGTSTPAAAFVGGRVKPGGIDDDNSHRSNSSSSISSFFSDSNSSSSSSDHLKDEDDNSLSLGSQVSESMISVGTDASECRTLDGTTQKPKERDNALLVGFARACRRRIPHNADAQAQAAATHYHGDPSPYHEGDESSVSTSSSAAESFTSDKPPPAGIRGHISRGLGRVGATVRANGIQRGAASKKNERKHGHTPKNIVVFPTSLLIGRKKEVGGRVA